jgi:hypothetical protein
MLDMYWVAFSSFGIKEMNPGHFTWIHGLSVWTIFSVSMAIWAARRHDIRQHRGWVVGTYFGLLGAGAAAVAFPSRKVPQTAIHDPLALLIVVVGVTALAWLLITAARPSAGWRTGKAADGARSRKVTGDGCVTHGAVTSSSTRVRRGSSRMTCPICRTSASSERAIRRPLNRSERREPRQQNVTR